MTDLEAGRELDALIATELMGWTKEGTPRGTQRLIHPTRGIAAVKERGREWVYMGYPEPWMPRYSTTYDGAGLVIERMRELGWEWEIGQDLTGHEWYATLLKMRNLSPTGRADTMPHAVCLAALKAVRSA